MCGIAGLIYKNNSVVQKESLSKMTDIMSHRGPDSEGFYMNGNLGLGHRRLSIIDVSDAANQPFYLEQKHVLVFNGAIYNYIELKEELKELGYTFKTHSDTEVLLSAYDCWGEECVKKFNGMWSFAIFDVKKNILFCSRDRFGIKPFYYYTDKEKFVFASEIKPILEIEKIETANLQTILTFLIINISDQTNETYFKDIFKLPGAHNLIYDLNTNDFTIRKYYDIEFNEEISKLNLEDSIVLFEKEFEKSIQLRLRSDVKIGAAVSSGLDSSYLAAVATKNLRAINKDDNFVAITVGSLDKEFDETALSEVVTDHLEIKHDIIKPKTDEFKNSFEKVIFIHEEPFGGISIYMQKFLMKEANKLGIKVLLDGQGADEILLGYSRYSAAYLKSHSFLKNLRFLKNIKSHYSISLIKACKIYFYYTNFSVKKMMYRKRGSIMKFKYFKKVDYSKTIDLTNSYKNIFKLQKNEIFWCQLPELLKWEDKNAMNYSIESRLPYLDYKFVEACLSINNNYKIKNGWSKYILRKNLEKYLPDEITYNNKKIGFNAPVEHWWPRSKEILETINNSKILQQILKKKIKFVADRDLEWRLYNIAVWERLYNMKLDNLQEHEN